MIGRALAHYRITAAIGAGGMGEVYRATDTKLGRDVALKVLPAEMAASPERLERFRREAQALAALDHPGIVTVYSVEEADGVHFLTMQLVEGQPLDRHIPESGMPVRRILEIATALAEALAAAHDKGIVHRDLKPGNAMVAPDGRVKVLDFGLAKVAAAFPGEGSGSELPTDLQTREGVVVGTVPYMSPEQVQGRAVDHRTDIFSLGVVLYEMATGRRPFQGQSSAELVSSILRDTPRPLQELRRELPPQLGVIVSRCLEKSSADRFPTARAIGEQLERLKGAAGAATAGTPHPAAKRRPFVGRDAEWAALSGGLDEAAEGRGSLVLLGGEPGVGKTCLAEELLAAARERGMLALTGHAYEDGGTAFITVVEVLEEMTRAVPAGELRRMLGDGASEIARLMPELRRRYSDIPEPLELPPEQQRRSLFNSLLELLGRAARAKPIVVLLDDLHWADESSLLLLEHFVPHLPGLPVLVLGTYRDVELEVGKPFEKSLARLVRQKLARRLAVKRLSEAEAARLVAVLAGMDPSPALAAAIYGETEGNPFFVTEVFQHLSEEGRLFDAEGRFKSDLVVDELDVPESVRLVVGRRLERLAAETLKLLTAAAVIGRRFEPNVLEAVTDSEPESVMDALEEAEAARLVSPVRGERSAPYEFVHELIRQTLLASPSTLRRQRMHLKVAESLEARSTATSEDRTAEVAYHLYQAGAAADAQKTIRYLTLAAAQALHTSASEEALRWLDSVEALGPALTSEQRGEVHFLRGLAERGLGRWNEFARHWIAALEIYEKAGGEDARLAQIGSDVSYHLFLGDQPTVAVEVAERALRAVSDDRARCQLQGAAGFAHGLAGEPRRAEELLSEAAELAQKLGDRALVGVTLTYRMQHQWAYLRAADASDAGLRAAEILRSEGSPWQLSNCLALTLMALHWSARLGEARQVADTLEALSARVPDHGASATISISRLFDRVANGRLDQAEPLAAACLEQVSRAGFPSHGHGYQAAVAFWRGRWDEARSTARLAVAGERSDAWRGWESAHHLYVEAYRAACAPDAARGVAVERATALLRQKRSLLPQAGRLNPVGSWGLALAMIEAAFVLGERELAAELYPLARETLGFGAELAFSFGLIRKLAGVAATAAGRFEEAEEHYRAALRQADELPYRIDGAEVRRWYARMLTERGAAGDRERAASLLAEARDLYQQLGMPKHVEMVAAS